MFEVGVVIDGEKYSKGSEPHKAAVVGDTVGDPFKDTSGPSLNILLKLMSVIALVIAPSIAITTSTTTSEVEDKIILEEQGRNNAEAFNIISEQDEAVTGDFKQ